MSYEKKITPLRNRIDEIDNQILDLLLKRFKIVKDVGELKKEYKIEPLDQKRWNSLLSNIKNKGQLMGLSNTVVDKIWNAIHSESLKIEK